MFIKCFRKDKYILIKTVYLLLATSWLGSLRLEFVIMGIFCKGLFFVNFEVLVVFCHGLSKGEFVRF